MSTERLENLEDGYVYERIRLGDFEREIKGPADYVERRMKETFEYIAAQRLMLPMVEHQDQPVVLLESDTPPLADDGASLEITNGAEQTTIDLVTFYTKKSPNGQYQQVAVITYWYQKCKGADSLETVAYNDYAAAYTLLRRAAVDAPTDVKGSVRNTHNRTDYIFSPSNGHFAMTIQGEKFVEEMDKQE